MENISEENRKKKPESCENCRFVQITEERSIDGKRVTHTQYDCRRYPRTAAAWKDRWCGEYAPKIQT
jgi:hypothetical protein